jgi:hypothetical protein
MDTSFESNLRYPEWCCLVCSHKFLFGKVKLSGGTGPDIPGNDYRLNCPNCRSVNIHPISDRGVA